jgi:hypothetical protein
MRIESLDRAENDLVEGYLFYETQQIGLGAYFLESLYSDIESLKLYAGIHRIAYLDYRRLVSKRFPFAGFYTIAEEAAQVHAVVESRRRSAWIREHLR